MRLFLRSILLIGFCAAAIFAVAPFTYAQYYVPQDKKTDVKKSPRIFKKPKPRITYNKKKSRKRASQKHSTLDDLFSVNPNFESSIAHFDKTNRLKVPQIYGGGYSAISTTTTAQSNCSTKQKNAIRSIQKYLDKKAKGSNLSLADKKVETFMASPDNAQKASNLAQKCSMNLGI